MKRFLKSLYIKPRFFIALFSIVVLFLVSYFIGDFFGAVKLLFAILIVAFMYDILLLYRNKIGVQASRILPEKLSNGDENDIHLLVINRFLFKINLKIIDEIPIQWQIRDFEIISTLNPSEEKKFTYHVRPTERGEYHFGHINVYSSTLIGLISRRQQFAKNDMVPNYPSFLQLKKYEFVAFTNKLKLFGLKKIRKIGHTLEFEQIKEKLRHIDERMWSLESNFENSFLLASSETLKKLVDYKQLMDAVLSVNKEKDAKKTY